MVPLKDELKAALLSPAPAIAWILLTVIVAYSGPFGTYEDMPLARRLLYWGAIIFVSTVCGGTVRVIVQRWLHRRGYWVSSLVTASILAFGLSVPLALFSRRLSAGPPHRVPSAVEMAFMVFVVGMGVSAFRQILSGGPPAAEPEAGAVPRLLERVDPALRGRIIRAAVDDHYVLLVTERGEVRLLMRFSDAMAELDGVDGLQVHRSHWVAADAVREAVCEKGRTFLSLTDGTLIPVSRNFREAVRERLGL